MRCRWCSNLNFLPGPTCVHCGEELFDRPDDDHYFEEPDQAEEELRDLSVARFKSFVVSIVAIGLMTFGSVTTYHRWPVHPPRPQPSPSPSPTPTPTPTPPSDPATQLGDIGEFLKSIKKTRADIPETLGSCSTVDTDLPTLQQVVKDRATEADQASNLATDAVSDGAALKEALINMTQATLSADQLYASWAQDAQSSGFCSDVPASGDIADANQTAADAKRAFVSLWNSDAKSYGLKTYSWRDL
jgi:hypothetical protein